jgi:glutamate dehydrogenase
LGFTQLGRIEFAANGGSLNTDSIDNSAGVDCSDHEVNIKILLNQLVHDGELTTKQRNELLAEMTDEVAQLVLSTNYAQTQALALATRQSASLLFVHARLLAALESAGRINREIDVFPSEEAIEERKRDQRGLTSPELSVLIGHVKLALFDDVLKSDVPNEAYFIGELKRYFPKVLQSRFGEAIGRHRLAREIISNVVVNEIVNRAGITFVFRMQEETGASTGDIVRAYYLARDAFAQTENRLEIESLDNVAAAAAQIELLLEGRKLVERAARWILRNRPIDGDVQSIVDEFRAGIHALSESLVDVVDERSRQAIAARADHLETPGVPRPLAARVAGFEELVCGFDIVEVARSTHSPIDDTAACYFHVGSAVDLHWLRDQINLLPRGNRWQALARTALREDLNARHRQLAAAAICTSDRSLDPAQRVADWLENQAARAQRSIDFIRSLKNEQDIDHAMLSAALREVRSLCDLQSRFADEIGVPAVNPEPSAISAA